MTRASSERKTHRVSWPASLWPLAVLALATAPAQAFETWVERRDAGVIRQSLDYSCGLAALATVLSDLGTPVSEAELLSALFAGPASSQGDTPRRDADAPVLSPPAEAPAPGAEHRDISFADLARLARQRGFSALGIAAPLETLKKLRVPAIVAMDIDGRAHFSVLRAVAHDGAALLADPSWGNRRLAAWEFERYALSDAAGEDGGRPLCRLLLLGPSDTPQADPGAARPAAPDWRWPVMLAPFAS